ATLYSRLKGEGDEAPLVLLQHLDVIPANPDEWSKEPFGGEVRDGYAWGRGALDMKGLGIAHLMTFLALYRSQEPLRRDIILLATADEEKGSELGLAWFLDNYGQLVENAGFALTEGGTNITVDGKVAFFGIETTQKVPLWLRLTVKGPSGHGAVPPRETASKRLIRALSRVLHLPMKPRIGPRVTHFFENLQEFYPQGLKATIEKIRLGEIEERELVALSPAIRALLTDTVTLTVVQAGENTNVVAPVAFAELDCRLLPGTSPEEFLTRVVAAIDDPAVQIEPILSGEPNASEENPELLTAIRQAAKITGFDAKVGSSVLAGFTDSRLLRAHGIASYGFSPFQMDQMEVGGVHAQNERIALDDFERGLRFFYRVIEQLALPPRSVP
ncbi:MAG: M20/M25/M40 family metallo-hydrolase, partial [Acidobacteriota bacterium]